MSVYIKILIALNVIQVAYANTYTVTLGSDENPSSGVSRGVNEGDLRYCINQVNLLGESTHQIVFALPEEINTIHLSGALPVLNENHANHLMIHGCNVTIHGNNYPGLVAKQGTIFIEDLTLTNCRAEGNHGSNGGGGGMGAGGALFIDQAAVTLSNVHFSHHAAIGGAGCRGTMDVVGGYSASCQLGEGCKGAVLETPPHHQTGGFGGGGGGNFTHKTSVTSIGGPGGGQGDFTSSHAPLFALPGGGGAGCGGSIFLNQVGETKGSLTIQASGGNVATMHSGMVSGGASGGGDSAAGMGASSGIFVATNSESIFGDVTFSPLLPEDMIHIQDSIGDDNVYTLSGGPGITPGVGKGLRVTLSGDGILHLSGANTYAGGTIINGGTLIVDADASMGKANTKINVNNDATLQTDASFVSSHRSIYLADRASLTIHTPADKDLQLIGSITGAGSIVKAGSATLHLTGINTYAGGTILNGGTLMIQSDAALGHMHTKMSVTDHTTLLIDGNFALSQRRIQLADQKSLCIDIPDKSALECHGTIVGDGSIVKCGEGHLTIHTSGAYSATNVQAGRLNVGSGVNLVTNVIVEGGILGGSGTITGSVQVDGGILSPGMSIGTLSIVNGPLLLNSQLITNIEINPTASSLIAVTGTPGSASLAGTLNVTADPGVYQNFDQIFLTASGGVMGTFASIVLSGLPGFIPRLVYSATSVELLILPLPNAAQFTGNRKALSAYLNALQFNPAYQPILSTLAQLSLGDQAAAFDSINAARNGLGFFTNANVVYSFATILESRMAMYRISRTNHANETQMVKGLESGKCIAESLFAAQSLPEGSMQRAAATEGKPHCIWSSGFGNFASQHAQNQLPSFAFNSEGAFIGYDYLGVQNGFVGASCGYARTFLHLHEHSGSVGVSSYVLGPYGSLSFHHAYVDLGLPFAINQNKNKRKVSFSGFSATYYSSHNSYQLTPHIELGYDYRTDLNIFEPFVEFDLVVNWEKGYSEKGTSSLLAMQAHPKTSFFLRSEVGLKIYQQITCSWGFCILRQVMAYVNKAPFRTKGFSAAIVDQAGSYMFETFTRVQNILAVEFEAMVKGDNGYFGSVEYDGEFFSGASNQAQLKFGRYF